MVGITVADISSIVIQKILFFRLLITKCFQTDRNNLLHWVSFTVPFMQSVFYLFVLFCFAFTIAVFLLYLVLKV